MPKPLELAGQAFGRMVVIERAENKFGKSCWLCRCSCGNIKVVDGALLKRGHTKSCGCLARELARAAATTHGKRFTRAHRIWGGIKQRCYNSKNPAFKYYGERGIRVCSRWLESFENFYADMGDPPPGFTLDRINNNGDYEPDNVQWATRKQQSQNRNCKRTLTYDGETLLLTEWATRLGINSHTLRSRVLQHHWPIERALTTP